MSGDIADMLSNSERMLDELKDTAIGMRTLPLTMITRRLPRAVRDLSVAAGKDVELVVTGADTELDRVILESLYDPLAHLLRNAVIHGIESPPERARAQKPARGRLEVRAVPRGSLVEIVVADDGRGVSPEVAGEARREGSLAGVLARAGYSTAREVTDLAGRGVGLDAVKSYVQSMGGILEIRSEPGQGMEVILLLPLALALLEALLFERGGTVYGVPLVVAEEVVMVTRQLTLEGRAVLEVRGRALPVADVAELVGARAPPLRDRSPALVIDAGGRRAVAACDAMLGAEEVVIKPLSPLFGGIEGYLGTAILGDGRIALLIDPAMLTQRAAATGCRAGGDRAGGDRGRPAGRGYGGPAATKVLVVEDSFIVRELQRNVLEAAGYAVVTARDGRDALRVLDRDTQIALVVTDLEMPELDGLGLTRAIRADAARASLPVVIVTSHGSEEDMRKGVEAGADAYMAKQASISRPCWPPSSGWSASDCGGAATRAGLRRLPRVRGRADPGAQLRRRDHGRRGLRHRQCGDSCPAQHQAGSRDHGSRASRHGRADGRRGDHELAAIADPGALRPRQCQRRAGGRGARGRST